MPNWPDREIKSRWAPSAWARSFIFLTFALLFLSSKGLTEVHTQRDINRASKAKTVSRPNSSPKPAVPYRGWSYLVAKLRSDGLKEQTLRAVFQDRRMPLYDNIPFRVKVQESPANYRHFLSAKKVSRGREYLRRYHKAFAAAEKKYKVGRAVIAGILLVETQYGLNTGKELVLNRLARLASLNEPSNVQWNWKRLQKEDPRVSFEEVAERGRYLEKTFYPELPALFEIAQRNKVDPLRIKGSSAGAFGLPQFLPSSFLKFGQDGNGDGVVSLFNHYDAIFSTANFLSNFGWRDDAPLADKKAAIWAYNHSEPYVNTVLKLAEVL